MTDVRVLALDRDVQPLLDLCSTSADIVVVTTASVIGPDVHAQLVATLLARPLAASTSPLPLPAGSVAAGSVAGPTVIGSDPDVAVPAVALPDHRTIAIRIAALRSDAGLPPADLPWPQWCARWALGSTRLGWRHLAAPGVVVDAGTSIPIPLDATTRPYVRDLAAPANRALEQAEVRARRLLGIATVAVDARLLRSEPRNGTEQHLLHTVRGLAEARPHVELVVLSGLESEQARRELAPLLPANVRIVGSEETRRVLRHAGRTGPVFDVLYRPFQIMRMEELHALRASTRRLVVTQLDTIAHANPWYHSTTRLFFVQRNVFQASMALADGVIVISEFARQSVLDEAPTLDPRRLATVPCGTDHVDVRGPVEEVPGVPERFVLTVGAGYAHKNRPFAMRVFDAMVEKGFTGALVIAGPHPPVGGSRAAEEDLALDLRRRGRAVHVLGPVSETSWRWLLARAAVVLYPSVVEGFGLVPFEAAELGTPTITTGGGALAEILGSDAELERWDPQVVAERALRLVEDPSARAAAVEDVQRAGGRHRWGAAAVSTWAHLDRITDLPPHAHVGPPEGGRLAGAIRVSTRPPVSTQVAWLLTRIVNRLRRLVRKTPRR